MDAAVMEKKVMSEEPEDVSAKTLIGTVEVYISDDVPMNSECSLDTLDLIHTFHYDKATVQEVMDGVRALPSYNPDHTYLVLFRGKDGSIFSSLYMPADEGPLELAVLAPDTSTPEGRAALGRALLDQAHRILEQLSGMEFAAAAFIVSHVAGHVLGENVEDVEKMEAAITTFKKHVTELARSIYLEERDQEGVTKQ